MNIIDFHTHVYPDAIAERTLAALSGRSGEHAVTDGTRDGLLRSMAEAGIARSVVLPVATRPEQVRKLNLKAAQQNGRDGILWAGAIHPDCENPEEELDLIRQAGLFGIKIHPDYQGAWFDDERYLRILEAAARRGLVTVTHAGADPGFPGEPVRCTPERVLRAAERLKGLLDGRLVLAHMGGADLPEKVLEQLAGKPFYLDTSFVLDRYPEMCRTIIRRHGADRVLFATDSPWRSQKDYVERILDLGLDERERELIFSGNAEKLLRGAGNRGAEGGS